MIFAVIIFIYRSFYVFYFAVNLINTRIRFQKTRLNKKILVNFLKMN